MKEHYIENSQFMIDILEEGSLSCHNKKLAMESYPRFAAAVDNPISLTGWR